MSNVVVGDVYRQIIEKIVQAAKNDFEEGGYAPDTLTDLKTAWQENLSKLKVAQMPWDPKPQAPQPPSMQQTVKSEPQDTATAARNGEPSRGPQIKQEIKYEADVKPDIKYETNSPTYGSMNSYAGGGINPMAQQRAAHLLTQQYGSQANASIQASGLPQQQQARPLALPGQQRAQQMTPVQRQAPPQYAQQHNVGASQTDGADDAPPQSWSDISASAHVPESERTAIDGMLRHQVEESFAIHDMGVGGTPSERKAMLKRIGRDQSPSSARRSAKRTKIGQTDGADEEDEDAINSDLDDSEDELEEQPDDDEGPLGEMILCTWDKVNRVKNKWKCTLKDGVLATSGKEYLFHKATGEFEW